MAMLLRAYPHDYVMTALVSLMADTSVEIAHSDDEMNELIDGVIEALLSAYQHNKHEPVA